MNRIKVLLIYPNITTYATNNLRRIIPPLGLAYLASYLENNEIDVSILDSALEGYYEFHDQRDGMITYGLGKSEIRKRIREKNPDLVGITCPFSCQSKNAIEMCKIVKEENKDVKVVIGGVHASALSKNILRDHPEIDFVVIGEGEKPLLNLAQSLKTSKLEQIKGIAYRQKEKVVVNKNDGERLDVNQIPFPARHLLNMEEYIRINLPHGPYAKKKRVGNIMTSRGCPGRCIYCASWKFFGRQFRARTVDSIFSEIELLIKKYNIEEIQFEDDSLTANKKRAREIFRRLKNYDLIWCTPNGVRIDTIDTEMLKLMKESGCYQLTFGIESGSRRVLREIIRKSIDLNRIKPIVKEAKRLGILVHLFFMVGLPTETKKEMNKTLEFAKYLNPDSASFAIATPLPGSDLYDYAVENNLIVDNFTVDNALYRKSCLKIDGFTVKEFEKFANKLNYKFNVSLIYRNPYRFLKKYLKFFMWQPNKIFRSFRKNA